MDNSGVFSVLMTDLSKAFDCIHHGLLITKLDAYGFDAYKNNEINSTIPLEQKTKG